MRNQQTYSIASSPIGSCASAKIMLLISILVCTMAFGASGVKAAHLSIDLDARSMPDLIATSVLVGRLHPDDFPDIIRHNTGYFSSYPNTFACLDKMSSLMLSDSLSNPQENMRDRAIETFGGSVPSSAYDQMPGGGDPRSLAAVQFAELAAVIPSILKGDDGPYTQSSFYQFTVLGWRYLAQISGYLSILEGQTTGDPLEDMFNKSMVQVAWATLNQMAVTAYNDTYQSALLVANAAC